MTVKIERPGEEVRKDHVWSLANRSRYRRRPAAPLFSVSRFATSIPTVRN